MCPTSPYPAMSSSGPTFRATRSGGYSSTSCEKTASHRQPGIARPQESPSSAADRYLHATDRRRRARPVSTFAPQDPDLLGGPAPGPVRGHELVVGRRRAGGSLQLDEVLHHEAMATNGPHHVAVRDLEVDGAFAGVEEPHPEVVVVETDVLAIARPVERQVQQP